ncbi:MAG: hypothetical protein ACI9BH_002570 [Paracoccaceae bacterium]
MSTAPGTPITADATVRCFEPYLANPEKHTFWIHISTSVNLNWFKNITNFKNPYLAEWENCPTIPRRG